MPILLASLIRHVAPVVALYVSSGKLEEHIAVAATAAVAFAWSIIEKKAGIKK
jgi:hypothetical protein